MGGQLTTKNGQAADQYNDIDCNIERRVVLPWVPQDPSEALSVEHWIYQCRFVQLHDQTLLALYRRQSCGISEKYKDR